VGYKPGSHPNFETGQDNPAYKHGMSSSPEFVVWDAVKQRCLNENSKDFPRYGGRGITIDPSWVNSFEQFYLDVGPRPEGTTLDRINNSLGYTKSNVRWATPKEQANNRRSNVFLDFNNKSLTISQWADELGVCRKALAARIRSGYSVEEALTIPFKRYGKRA
jgi:hypothetical protein